MSIFCTCIQLFCISNETKFQERIVEKYHASDSSASQINDTIRFCAQNSVHYMYILLLCLRGNVLNIIELDDLLVQKLALTFHEMCARVSVNVIEMQNESLQYPNDTDRCQRKLEQAGDGKR